MEENSGLYGDGDGTFVPFTDILFNALLGFTFMLFTAFVLINPDAKTGEVESTAEFMITVSWPDNHPDDIDTYVRDPAGNIVWYNIKEAGLMHLDRDDRGNYRDTILVNNQEIVNPLNQEIVAIRGLLGGEFTVNIYQYLANSTDTVPVSVKVEKINPIVTLLYYETLELGPSERERTAVRFTIDAAGAVTDISSLPASLVAETRRRQ